MGTLEKKIREMNREVLRLKTSHPLKSNMITFIGTFNYTLDDDGKNHKYEITYVEGEQPIITITLCSARAWDVLFGEPSGNKQIMFDMDAHHSQGSFFVLASSRQILSVRKIS